MTINTKANKAISTIKNDALNLLFKIALPATIASCNLDKTHWNYNAIAFEIMKDKNGNPDSIKVYSYITDFANTKADNTGMLDDFSASTIEPFIDQKLGVYPLDSNALKQYHSILTEALKVDTQYHSSIHVFSEPHGNETRKSIQRTYRDEYLEKELFKFARDNVPDSVKKGKYGILLEK